MGCLLFGAGNCKENFLSKLIQTIEQKRIPCIIYETSAGYRVVITDRLLAPGSSESDELMKQLNSDQLYSVLCVKHQCYRARLTPKPFRMNMMTPKITVENIDSQEIQNWIKEYTVNAQDYSICRKVYDGARSMLPEVDEVLKIHDHFTIRDGSLA